MLLLFTSTPQSHFVRQLHVEGSLLVQYTNSHIKPALKGEVDMSVSEWTEGLYRGYCCLRQPLSQSALRA